MSCLNCYLFSFILFGFVYLERKRCFFVNILGMRFVGCIKVVELIGVLYFVFGFRGFLGFLYFKIGYCVFIKYVRFREGVGIKLVNFYFTFVFLFSFGFGFILGRGYVRVGYWFRYRFI